MLCRFLNLGGKEKEGVQTLSESYVGLPHVINVLIEWLHAAGMPHLVIRVYIYIVGHFELILHV